MNAYFLWIEFLKTTDPATWTDPVRADFGSCIAARTAKWVDENRILWNGPRGAPAPKPYNGEPLQPHELALWIDVSAPDDVIVSRVMSYVDAVREDSGITHSRSYEIRQGKYTFSGRPNTDALEIALYAWQHRETKPLWKLGEELCRRFPIAIKIKAQADGPDRRKVLSDITGRYLKKAESIRCNVTQGVFP